VIKNYKIIIYYILLCLVLTLGFILRLKGLLSNPSFWHDESALAWNVLNKSYVELFDKLRFLQIAPPFFLIITKFLVFLTDSYNHVYRCDMVLRILPFIFGNLSIIMFYILCKKVYQSKWTNLAAVAFVALNPTLINYSFEFKPYSTDVFCCLLVIYIFMSIDFKIIELKQIFKYGFILSILPWFSFASTFAILSGFMILSFKKENPAFFTSLLALPVTSAFLYLNLFVVKIYTQNSAGMIGYWHNAFVNKDFSNIHPLITDNFNYFFQNIPHFSITIAGLCIFAGIIIFCKKSDFLFTQISLMIFATLICASMLKFYPFSTRMILFLIPILVIYMVKITDIKNCFVSWLIVAILLIPHFIFAVKCLHYQNINRNDYARNMMNILSVNIYPQDIIILNETSNADFLYYNTFFKLNNKIEYLKPDIKNKENNTTLLNRLNKGKYIMFLSYDCTPHKSNINEIRTWAYKNAKVIYEIKSTQSTLMWLILQ